MKFSPAGTTLRPLVRMLSWNRGYRLRLLTASLLLCGATCVLMVYPLGLRMLVNSVIYSRDRRQLFLIVAWLSGLFVVRAVLTFGGAYLSRQTGERISARIRSSLFSHLQTLPFSFFSEEHIDDVASRLNNDVSAVRRSISESSGRTITHCASLVSAVAIMLWVNWRLALLAIVAAPVVSMIAYISGGKLQTLGKAVQEKLSHANAAAVEALRGIELVKTFGREEHEKARYTGAVQRLLQAALRVAKIHVSCFAFIDLLFLLSMAAVFWFGGLEVIEGRLTAGDLVAFLIYSERLSGNVSELARNFANLNTALGAARRLFDLLDSPSEPQGPACIVPERANGALRFDNLGFVAGGRTVLDNISLDIEAGESIALVGKSGAGKSTLLRLIPLLYQPTTGAILLDGRDTRALPLTWLRSQISMVSQDVILLRGSIRDNIRYGDLLASDAEIEAAARKANAHDFIMQMPKGYDTEIGEVGTKLSGGERQRVSIARAFLKNAPVLLMDEPFSSIDAGSEELIFEALHDLMCRRTTLIVSHRNNVTHFTHRVIVLDHGKVAAFGVHEELLSSSRIYCEFNAEHQMMREMNRENVLQRMLS